MRDQTEIQRVHDLLVAIIVGEVPNPATGLPANPKADDFGAWIESVRLTDPALFWRIGEVQMRANADVLCWILLHDHNKTFARNFGAVEAWLKKGGFVLDIVRCQSPGCGDQIRWTGKFWEHVNTSPRHPAKPPEGIRT